MFNIFGKIITTPWELTRKYDHIKSLAYSKGFQDGMKWVSEFELKDITVEQEVDEILNKEGF